MGNYLNLRCPQCGGKDDLQVQIRVWATLTDDGSDVEGQDHEYDEESPVTCAACNYSGWMHELKGEPK